jgi:acyl carrier protein
MRRTRQEIVNRIAEEVQSVTLNRVRANEVLEQHRLLNDLRLDSLGYATVLLRVESWLGVHVVEDYVDWLNIQTVAQMADFLEAQQ